MPKYYEYELGKAAYKLVNEMLKLKPEETLVITADTESDARVVNATAAAAFATGAKLMVIWIPSPLGVGKAADAMLPIEALIAALKVADVWVEFNNKWLLYSTPYEIAVKENKKLRYLCLAGMNVDMMVRLIARVDLQVLSEYVDKLVALLRSSKHLKITTPKGSDVIMEIVEPIGGETGYADAPGAHMLGGQVGPGYTESINGTIVFDGSIVPPIGILKEPVKLYVEKGEVVKIEGGEDAKIFEAWLKSFRDLRMFRIAHVCFGCHPGAKLTGNIIEDERIWGCVEWGLGYVAETLTLDGKPIPAASHADGVCLNASVWLDGEQIWDQGKTVHPELAELARKLGKT